MKKNSEPMNHKIQEINNFIGLDMNQNNVWSGHLQKKAQKSTTTTKQVWQKLMEYQQQKDYKMVIRNKTEWRKKIQLCKIGHRKMCTYIKPL